MSAAHRPCIWEATLGQRCGRPVSYPEWFCDECEATHPGNHTPETVYQLILAAVDYRAQYNFGMEYLKCRDKCDKYLLPGCNDTPGACSWLVGNGRGDLKACGTAVEFQQLLCEGCTAKVDMPEVYPPIFIEAMLKMAQARLERVEGHPRPVWGTGPVPPKVDPVSD